MMHERFNENTSIKLSGKKRQRNDVCTKNLNNDYNSCEDERERIFCENCGNDDPYKFSHVYELDRYSCTCCGLVSKSIHHGSFLAVPRAGGGEPAAARRRCGETYARRAHICERISQALQLEPIISRDDMLILKHEYIVQNPGACTRENVTRERIQRVLKTLNKELPTLRWTTRYLEKWKSIKNELIGGGEPSAFSHENAITIGAMFVRLSAEWDIINSPHLPDNERYFPERQHFPNFNATFRACCYAAGIPHDPKDFPIPEGRRCRHNINRYLSCLFERCGYMFIEI